MSEDWKRRARLALTWALVALCNLAAFVPRLAIHNGTAGGVLGAPATRPTVPGISYELGLLLCVLALTAGTRLRRSLRVLAVVLYSAFLVFSIYHEAFMRYVYFAPTIVDDLRLSVNLMHFVRAASAGWFLFIAPPVIGYFAAIALAAWAFGRVQTWAKGVSLRARAGGALAFAVIGGAAVTWAPPAPLNAIVQPLSDGLIANIRSSRLALANWRAIAATAPDTRYDSFASAPLTRRPNVYLLMIEAYGESLATCKSNAAYQELLARMSKRLEASGFHARSGYSSAPIYGARSWMTMASVQTGIHIDTQPAYRVLEEHADRLPTMTTFFKAHGYHTMMLQPLDAPRFGVMTEDVYRRDRAVIRSDLPYRGPHSGLAGVPDQYSLGYFDEHFLTGAPQPRFVFYMAVSTHYMWWSPGPFVRDYRRLDGPLTPDDIVPWPALEGRAAITDQLLSHYLDTIEYEWRALADFLDARKNEDALILIVGDHQPLLQCPGVPMSMNTPIHVLSRDPRLVELFADQGLSPGLYTEPGKIAPLKHEGLYSLIVSKLTSLDRPPGAVAPAYFPSGIPQSGLRR